MRQRNTLAGRTPGSLPRRAVRGAVRRGVHRTFWWWPRIGVWILPQRYDDPVPERRHQTVDYVDRRSDMVGIDLRDAEQLALLEELARRFGHEWRFPAHATGARAEYFHENGSFGVVDAEVLHGLIRKLHPAHVVELGSGMSTRLIAGALERNRAEGTPGELTVVDPYPGDVVAAGFPGITTLVRSPAQDVPFATFEKLGPDDLLFVDSSHMLKTGSDVHHIMLEVLPRLRTGVVVHFHDISLPREYPIQMFDQRWYWNEQYVLQAFLSFNDAYEVLWGSSWQQVMHPDALAAAIPGLNAHGVRPSSFYIRRK